MSVETDIATTLEPLAPNSVYPDEADKGAEATYIVYQEISGIAPVFLENAIPSKKNGRFQITVWASTRVLAAEIGLRIEEAMVMSTLFQAKPIGGRTADFDKDTGLRGSRQDFSVWSDR